MTLRNEQFTIHPVVTEAGSCRLGIDIEYPTVRWINSETEVQVDMNGQDVVDVAACIEILE